MPLSNTVEAYNMRDTCHHPSPHSSDHQATPTPNTRQRIHKPHHLYTDTHLPLVSIDRRFSPSLHTIVSTRAPRPTNPTRPIRPLVNRSLQLSSRMHSNVIRTTILPIYITPRLPKARMIRFNAQSVVELPCSGWWFVFWERGHFLLRLFGRVGEGVFFFMIRVETCRCVISWRGNLRCWFPVRPRWRAWRSCKA